MSENPNTFGASINKALKDDGDDFLNVALRKWKFSSKYIRNQRLFIGLFVFFLIFGSIFLGYYLHIKEVVKQYDKFCANNLSCTMQIEITDYMTQPIQFYYQIDNFYQTHRKFYSSKDIFQLRGEIRSADDLTSCAPFVTNSQLGKVKSIENVDLVGSETAIPCGLIARTFFNGRQCPFINQSYKYHSQDTFKLFKEDDKKEIKIDETGIAWDVDVDFNYKQSKDANTKAWINVTDEHFMVWMRTSGMGRIKKLWGHIRSDLPAGMYQFQIQNNYNSQEFSGTKSVILTTSSPFGQKNLVLVIAYFVGAFVCAVSIAVLFSLNKSKKDQ